MSSLTADIAKANRKHRNAQRRADALALEDGLLGPQSDLALVPLTAAAREPLILPVPIRRDGNFQALEDLQRGDGVKQADVGEMLPFLGEDLIRGAQKKFHPDRLPTCFSCPWE